MSNIQLSITSFYTTFPDSLRKQSFAFMIFGIGMGVIGFLKIFHTIRRQSMDTKAGFTIMAFTICKSLEMPGIDPGTSRMLSERSTI